MRKLLIPALCLCLLLCMGVTAYADTGELIDVSGGTGGGASQEPGGGGGASEPPPTTPEVEVKYTITIAAPRGWHTKSATVTVTLEDANGTGFEKAEAKLGSNGAWQDISDGLRSYGQAQIDISDNGTVYVAVTDKKGKAHVKSLYIECFDREAPTVRARIDGRSLRAETDDALSGAEYIYVNGYSFDELTNGTLDIRVKEYVDADEGEIFVYAVDYAGNRSKTVTVKNPYYEPPQSSTASSAPPASSAPAAQPPAAPVSQAPVTQAPAAPVVSAPAASQPAASVPAQAAEPAQSDADRDSVTPTDGTGTVTENSIKTPEQREFFSITTEAGNDFHIVVDKQKADKNVYLLSEVTEDDLAGLAKPSETAPAAEPPPVEPAPLSEPEPEPEVEPEPEPEPEPAEPEPAPPSDTGMYVIILILAVAFGGGVYYFKIVRPKKDAPYAGDEDEDMDMEMEDEPDYPEYPDDDIYYPEQEYAGAEDSGQREESGAADA